MPEPTQSVLTITSNVVYGKDEILSDGRRAGEPFGPGANPMRKRYKRSCSFSCISCKLPFEDANDGISATSQLTPETVGKTEDERKSSSWTIRWIFQTNRTSLKCKCIWKRFIRRCHGTSRKLSSTYNKSFWICC